MRSSLRETPAPSRSKSVRTRLFPLPLTGPRPLTPSDPLAEMLDYDVPSDDEDYDPTQGQKGSESAAPTPRPDGAASSPAPFLGDDGESQRGGDDYDDESEGAGSGSGYDSDLAKEIEKDLGLGTKDAAGTDDSDDDGDGLFGGSSDDDDDDDEPQAQAGGDAETLELRNQIKEAAEAMASLDKAIEKKEAEIAKATNVLFKVRRSRPSVLLSSTQKLTRTSIPLCRNALRRSYAAWSRIARPSHSSTTRPHASSTRSVRTRRLLRRPRRPTRRR